MSEKDEKIREAGDYLEYKEIPKGKPGEAMLIHLRDSVKAADNLEEANKLQGRLCQDSEQRYDLMTSMELDALLQDQYQDRECREFLVDGAILTCTQSTRENQWVGIKESPVSKCICAAKGTDMAAEGIKMDEKGSGHLLDPDRVYGKLATKENGMWTDGKRHATVTDSSSADNIPCFGNCDRPPDSKAEKDFIQEMYWEGKAEGRIPKESWGTCYCLRNLEAEWENYYIWDRTYATFPNEEGELESGITMTSMLFCKHGGFIYPVTSGQGIVCRVPEEVEGVIAEEQDAHDAAICALRNYLSMGTYDMEEIEKALQTLANESEYTLPKYLSHFGYDYNKYDTYILGWTEYYNEISDIEIIPAYVKSICYQESKMGYYINNVPTTNVKNDIMQALDIKNFNIYDYIGISVDNFMAATTNLGDKTGAEILIINGITRAGFPQPGVYNEEKYERCGGIIATLFKNGSGECYYEGSTEMYYLQLNDVTPIMSIGFGMDKLMVELKNYNGNYYEAIKTYNTKLDGYAPETCGRAEKTENEFYVD